MTDPHRRPVIISLTRFIVAAIGAVILKSAASSVDGGCVSPFRIVSGYKVLAMTFVCMLLVKFAEFGK